MNPSERIKKLQEEIYILQEKNMVKQKEVDANRRFIKELYHMADLLQSYIPERGAWRDVHKWRHN